MIQLPFDIQSIEEAYRNTEEGTRGFYPIGGGNFWHGGIHIHSKKISTIKPIVSGSLAAYRIQKEYKKQDSPLELIRGEYERLSAVDQAKYTNELSKYGMVFRLKESVPQEQRHTPVSDNFILLKHSYKHPELQKSPLVFYTLYMNLAPAQEAGADAYDSRFVCDGSIHIVSEKETFYPKTLGAAGLDTGERYIDVALITEGTLFSYTEKSGKDHTAIRLFDRIDKSIAVYTATKREEQACARYITSGSRFTILDTDSGSEGTALKIQLESVFAYLPSGSMGSTIAVGKKEKVTNTHFILLCDSTHKIDFTTKTTNDTACEYLVECLKGTYKNYENTKKVITKVAGTQPQIEVVFDELGISEKPTYWVIATSFMNRTSNSFSSNGSFLSYEENPFACDFSAVTLTDEEKEKMNGCADKFALDTAQVRYRKVQDSVYYIKETDAQTCYKSAFDWKAWFIDTSGNTGASKGILCDRTEVLKNSEEPEFLSEILNGEKRLSAIKHTYIFGGGELFEHAPRIKKGMRKLLCTHPLERDASLFSNIKKDYDACTFVGFQTETQAENLRANAQALDIWKDALQHIFKTNMLHFVHPIYFLHHLDRAGLFEFNPYEGKTISVSASYSQKKNKNTDVQRNVGSPGKTFSVSDNPGFAPVATTGTITSYEYNGAYYAEITGAFNEDYLDIERANGNTYREDGHTVFTHEGIDFRGNTTTAIHALINGVVLAYGWFGTYGRTIFVAKKGGKGIYLLAHLHSYNTAVLDKKDIAPSDVVGFVGGSGSGEDSAYAAHLHLTYFDYQYGEGDVIVNKKIDTISKGLLYDEMYNNIFNPMIHTEKKLLNQQ